MAMYICPCLQSQTEHSRSREPVLNSCTHNRICDPRGLSNTSVENWLRFEGTGVYFRTKLVNVQLCSGGKVVIEVRGDLMSPACVFWQRRQSG
jgi:hypothetical protein